MKWKFLLVLSLSSLWLVVTGLPQTLTLVVGANVKVIHDNNNQLCATRPTPALDCANYMQNEPPLAIDPTNPDVLISGSNDYRLIPIDPAQNSVWLGYYRSEDGGQTWANTLVPGFPGDTSPEGQASPLKGVFFTGDPVVAFDGQGNAYMGGIGLSADEDLVLVAKYRDQGKTFDRTTVVNRASAIQGQFIDKPCIAVDHSGGMNEGTVYVGWSRFAEIVVVARSTDGGASFSDPVIASGTRAPTRTCAVTVGPDGALYVVWRQFAFGTNRDSMLLNVSRDGGKSFDFARFLQTIVPYNQEDSNLVNFRTTSFPTISADENGVYIAWEDARFQGASRVLLICSSNGGQTWTQPMRVANVERGHQIMPQVFADGKHVGVAFYDSRNDPNFSSANAIGDALDIYYVEYPSGCPLQGQGATVRVTDQSFNPNLKMFAGGSVPFIGDYIGLASDGQRVHVVWTDNRDVKPQPLTNPPCVASRIETLTQGCRNQNIYMATITRR